MEFKILHKLEPGTRLKVCAYARISNDKEILESSLDEQIDAYTTIILDHPMWEFSGIYVDKGISGTSLNERKQFLKMISDAERGLIDVILVKSISRFARNLIDLLEIVRKLRRIDVEVFFEQQNMSSLDPTCDQMITLFAEFAEEEARSVSQNVSWRNDKNRMVGRYYLPAKQMVGFDFDENGEVIVNEKEAVYINKLYDMYLEGVSFPAMCKMMNESGISTVTGGPWIPVSIRCILKNEKYCGDCIMQKEYVEDFKTHKRVRNYGERNMIYVQDGHPAIVSRDKWRMVQERTKQNRARYCNRTMYDGVQPNAPTTPFTKFFYCPYCGHNYQIKTNKHSEYSTAHNHERKFIVCGSNVRRKQCTESTSIFLETVTEAIKAQLDILKNNLSPLKEFITDGLSEINVHEINDEIVILDSKIDKLRGKYDSIRQKYDEFSIALKTHIKNEIHALTKDKIRKQTALLSSEEASFRANDIIKVIKKMPAVIDDLQNIDFRSVFSRCIVKDKKTLIFVIGNEDVSGIRLNAKTSFNGKVEYKIRATTNYLEFGLIIAK